MRKKGYPGLPHVAGARGFFLNNGMPDIPWWGIAIMVIIIIRAITNFTS